MAFDSLAGILGIDLLEPYAGNTLARQLSSQARSRRSVRCRNCRRRIRRNSSRTRSTSSIRPGSGREIWTLGR